MDKRIIEKIITETINKCRLPSYTYNNKPNLVKNAFNKFNKQYTYSKGKNGKIEHCLSVDRKGEKLANMHHGSQYQVEVNFDESLLTLVQKECKDLHNKFHNREINEGEYEQQVSEILNKNNNGIYTIHNHPTTYQEAEKDNPIITCLSDGDVSHFKRRIVAENGLGLYNVIRVSKTSCSNGTSMLLINHNPINPKELGFDENKFNKAYNDLYNEWGNYLNNLKKDLTITSQGQHLTSHQQEIYKKHPNKDWQGLTEKEIKNKIREEIKTEIKEKNKTIFPKQIKYVMDEFKEIGFELKIDFRDT